MPWEKQFDVDDTLRKAMEAFWAKGYEATSMQDLVHAMEINPGSIYSTYGNKRALFIQALGRYRRVFRGWFKAYADENSPRGAILAVFERITNDALEKPNYHGCLLVNTALELAPHDKEIGHLVAEGLKETENFFCKMIQDGQAVDEIRKNVDPLKTAYVLVGLLMGLRVLSRGRPERRVLKAITEEAQRVLQ